MSCEAEDKVRRNMAKIRFFILLRNLKLFLSEFSNVLKTLLYLLMLLLTVQFLTDLQIFMKRVLYTTIESISDSIRSRMALVGFFTCKL